MIESGYYPPGAEFDPNAPYNQTELPEREFEVTISQTLSKTVTVFTNDYNLEVDCDEDGGYEVCDTSDTAWKEAYEDNLHTPAQLIKILKLVLEENKKKGIVFKSEGYTNDIIEECDGWCVDDYEVVE